MKFVLSAVLLVTLFGGAVRAQTPADANQTLRVFLDCRTYVGCDFDFFRTEITFVDYVRERQDADLHLLVTSEGTGGGGRRFTVEFIGQRRMTGRDNRLRYTSTATATDDEVRRGLARVIKAGLLPYALETPAGERLEIRYAAPAEGEEGAATAAPARDPWNFWTFSIGANGFLSGNDTYTSTNVFGNVSASRVTAARKTQLSLNNRYSENSFDLGDRTVTTIQRNSSANALSVWSLTDHWSVGGRSSLSSSTFENQDLRARLAPAVEYSFFPYAESTNRQITLQYSLGVNYLDYEFVTLFGKTEETLADHRLTLSTDFKKTWGSVDVELEGSHYLHDLSTNRLELDAGVNVRLFKGLSLRLNGNAERIRDQLFLSAEELTPEQILLNQRALKTGFQYFGSFGLSYTFGSPFNNVVNPRF